MSAKTQFRTFGKFLSILAALFYDFASVPSRLMTQRRGAAHIVAILLIIIIILLVLIFLSLNL